MEPNIETLYHSPSDYADKWYCDLEGLQFLHKYPQDFIDWIDEEDTWAETIVFKRGLTKIIELFTIWVNENY
jgi:hypothetical protein